MRIRRPHIPKVDPSRPHWSPPNLLFILYTLAAAAVFNLFVIVLTVIPADGVIAEGAAGQGPTVVQYMLDYINLERAVAGVAPVSLGDNPMAQVHASDMFHNCYLSHWDLQGRKPFMRYSSAGRARASGENLSELRTCPDEVFHFALFHEWPTPLEQTRITMEGFVASPDHASVLRSPRFDTVSVGLAWDRSRLYTAHVFEGGSISITQLPAISPAGRLTVDGVLDGYQQFEVSYDLAVQIYYDPPLSSPSQQQLGQTRCYDPGLIVASLYPGGTSFRPSGSGHAPTFQSHYSRCPTPTNFMADGEPLDSPGQRAWRFNVDGPQVDADHWIVVGSRFSVSANIHDVLRRHGPGIYTTRIWGPGDLVHPSAEYSVTWEGFRP